MTTPEKPIIYISDADLAAGLKDGTAKFVVVERYRTQREIDAMPKLRVVKP